MRTTARRTHEVAVPRRRMPRAEREAQILSVAEEVFADLGYQATTMDEIAERVGVTKPLIYDYFGSKDGLLIACVDRARTLLADTTEEALQQLPPGAPVDEVLRCGIAAFFEFIDEHDLAFRLLHQESAAAVSTERDVERIRAQQGAVIVGFLRRSPGLAEVPEQLVEGYAEVVVGACERVAVWRTHRDGVTAADATDLVVSAVWTGLRTLTGAAATA
ncbi:TetR/AcrR family transcriptional regulator [Lapillicoccus jejuensis]|uniref:TetR/AcrR family transcriptional regulator n=1 Tax=Lapillicoccus jejuensis TaxID=402171 RepID=UPI001FE59C12|nr:TetR/AcrR family transcriptional regulator [Lapillicoccus jejuensis]